MQINYLGQFCFKIKTAKKTIILDPFEKNSHGFMPKTETDIVIFSSTAKKSLTRITNTPFIIDGPGEYKIGGVFILGIAFNKNTEKETTIYSMKAEDLRICYLDNIKAKLTEKQLEQIGEVDILFIPPINANKGLDVKGIAEIVNDIEPCLIVVVPNDNLKFFLNESGFGTYQKEKKLIIKKADLPEETQIVLLEP